jgi:hypothetical protein
MIWLKIGPVAGFCEHGNELWDSVKFDEFFWLDISEHFFLELF